MSQPKHNNIINQFSGGFNGNNIINQLVSNNQSNQSVPFIHQGNTFGGHQSHHQYKCHAHGHHHGHTTITILGRGTGRGRGRGRGHKGQNIYVMPQNYHQLHQQQQIGPFKCTGPRFNYGALSAYGFTSKMMKLHHQHHKNIHKKLTNIVTKQKHIFGNNPKLEDIVRDFDGNVSDLAGEVFSHNFFFNCLTPNGGDKLFFKVDCKNRIGSEYDTFEGLKKQFEKVALKAKSGSSFIYLQANKDESYARLEVIALRAGETPLKRGHYPLLCIDMWEHAYLDNNIWRNGDEGKKAYIRAFFKCINWEYVNKMYDKAFPRFPMFGMFGGY